MNKNDKNNAISNFYLIESIKFNSFYINSMNIKFNSFHMKCIFLLFNVKNILINILFTFNN